MAGTRTKARLVLRLYVAGRSPNSLRAISNAQAICNEYFAADHELEIIDLTWNAGRAMADGVIVTPTLLRLLPLPDRRVVGDLNDTKQVLKALAATTASPRRRSSGAG